MNSHSKHEWYIRHRYVLQGAGKTLLTLSDPPNSKLRAGMSPDSDHQLHMLRSIMGKVMATRRVQATARK